MNRQYDKFIDELIDRREFSELKPKFREQFKKEAKERLDNFLLNRIVDALPDNDLNVFITMVKEKKSMEDITQFVSNEVDNYETFINKAFNDFAYMYLSQ